MHVLESCAYFEWENPSNICVKCFYKNSWIFYNLKIFLRRILCQQHTAAYVYWTVHHLDSWIKRDQLDVTWFFISLFNAQHISGVNTSILRSLRIICWVISWVVLLWYDLCWCYVVVWLGLCDCNLYPDTTPSQPNHNVTPTHIVPEQYNPWNK